MCPSDLCSQQKCDAFGHVVAPKGICAREFVLPTEAQQSAEATLMEVVELVGVSAVDSPHSLYRLNNRNVI